MGGDIFHTGKYYVSLKRNVEEFKKDITISIMRVFERDSLRILLSNEEDPSFLCILNVTRSDYEDLKKQQGLLIDFDNFPAQLVRLLQQCAANNMFLSLQQSNPLQYYFEIVEHNEFRRLVHLSLKSAPANDDDVKKHMLNTINNLKTTLSSIQHTALTTEALLNEKCIGMERKIHDLTLKIAKMEEDKQHNEAEFQEALKREKDRIIKERIEWQKSNEIKSMAHVSNMQEMINRKDKEVDELSSQNRKLQDNLTSLNRQLSEKCQRFTMLEREIQNGQIEVATIKTKNANLEKEILERDNIIHQTRAKCLELEKKFNDNNEYLRECENKIKLQSNEKKSLEERLALSESLGNRNNEAAQCTSEQLLKANQIISKQNNDLIEMKEKLLCRTAIAIEQEKVIERNSKEIEELKVQLQDCKVNLTKVQSNHDVLKEKFESNEAILKDRDETIKNNNMVIQWMHKKMEENCLTSCSQNKPRFGGTTSSSTPYLLNDQNNYSQDESSRELPNFYATSRLSDIDESLTTEVISNNGKSGLDQKYLQPALNEERKGSAASKIKSGGLKKGKENKTVTLPKVDYREKESSRSSKRTTPVSAYFH